MEVTGAKSGPFIAPIVMKDSNGNERKVIDTNGNFFYGFQAGNQYFVDSGATGASDSNDGLSWGSALATLDAAIGKCTANNGDIIWVAPGHTETYSTTGAKVTIDVAGVTIIGLGTGAARPVFNFGHTGATWTISANSAYLMNLVFYTTVDQVVTFATISGHSCTFVDIETRDQTDKEVVDAFITTAAADHLTVIRHFHNGYVDGDANARVWKLVGCNNALFEACRFMTKVTTAVINFVGTACSNIIVKDSSFLVTSTTNYSKTVVDTVTGSTWEVTNCFDMGAGKLFGGGSGASLAGVDVSAVAADVTTLKNVLYDTTGIASWANGAAPGNGVSLAEAIRYIADALCGTVGLATFPAAAVAANDVSMAEVLRAVQEAVINGTGAAMPTNQSLYDLLAGSGGIKTFPAAAVPANDVSLAEVIRDIWDSLRNGTGGSEPGTNRSIIDEIRGSAINYGAKNYLSVSVDMTSATWNTVATHELFTVTGAVRMRIMAEVTSDCTSGGGTATIKLGVEGATGTWISATGEDDLDNGDIWFDATPTETNGNFSSLVLDKVVAGGLDVGYEIENEAFTQGAIVFHCWWEGLNATGAVAAGAGGVL
jgi:hypothetical protein